MKKKVITITANGSVLESLSLLLVTLKPQNLVMEVLTPKTIRGGVYVCLN